MDKQVIEKIALEVASAMDKNIDNTDGVIIEFAHRFLSRIDAERRKDAVATFCSRRLEPRGTNEFWGLLRDGVSLEAGDELFLSPTIPEGMALIESSLLEMAIDLTDEASNEDFTRQPLADELRGLHLMLAAAQGEK